MVSNINLNFPQKRRRLKASMCCTCTRMKGTIVEYWWTRPLKWNHTVSRSCVLSMLLMQHINDKLTFPTKTMLLGAASSLLALHYFSSLPQMCIHTENRGSWSAARDRPCSFSAETALSNSVSCLWGETPLSTVILQLFTSCPCLCLSHLINPHSNKGKQPRTFQTEARAALLTQCMCKLPAQRVSDSEDRLSFIYRR